MTRDELSALATAFEDRMVMLKLMEQDEAILVRIATPMGSSGRVCFERLNSKTFEVCAPMFAFEADQIESITPYRGDAFPESVDGSV
jgi:hypothetical protein